MMEKTKLDKEIILGAIFGTIAIIAIIYEMSLGGFSKGGYYWQGRDFAESGSGANNQFYQNGFHFRSPRHDIFSMGDKISNASWKYKYESTAAAGRTIFMRLTKTWKDAHNTEKWHGGR